MKKFLLFFVAFSLAALSGCGGSDTPVTPVDIAAPTVAATAESEPTIEPAPSPSAEPTPEQPAALTDALVAISAHYRDLDCEQLIVVDGDGSAAQLSLYARSADGAWSSVGEPIAAHVGQKGVTYDKREGDKKTPGGIFHIGFAFGNADKPATALEWHDVTDDSYWVDDPDSQYHNTWVEGTANKDWDSAERLSRIDGYKYALVIEYNYADACVPDKGSAIFLHVGDGSTVGCVAVAEADMLALLNWLDPMAFPQIIITE